MPFRPVASKNKQTNKQTTTTRLYPLAGASLRFDSSQGGRAGGTPPGCFRPALQASLYSAARQTAQETRRHSVLFMSLCGSLFVPFSIIPFLTFALQVSRALPIPLGVISHSPGDVKLHPNRSWTTEPSAVNASQPPGSCLVNVSPPKMGGSKWCVVNNFVD